MLDILNAVSKNPLVPVGGILLGVIGIVLAVVFYIRSRRVSSVRYDYTAISLVEGLSDAMHGIEVTYKGAAQDRITVTHFVFWNAGTETIRSNDFTDDPLRIKGIDDVAILDHRIIVANDATNKVEIGAVQSARNEISIPVRFDYLDSNDGAVIQIVHDGSVLTGFRLAGSLKGNCSITMSASPAYQMERFYRFIPFLGVLMKSRLFGWIQGLFFLGIGLAALIAPFLGASWWYLALAAFSFLVMWSEIYAYAISQVPSHFQRELGRLPMANKAMDSDKE